MERLSIKLKEKIKQLQEKDFSYGNRARLPRKLYFYSMRGEVDNNKKIKALTLALKVVEREKITPYELYDFYYNVIPETRKNDEIIHELYWNPYCPARIMRKAFEEIITLMCPVYKKKILKYDLIF